MDRNGNKNGSKNFVQEKSSVLEIGIGNNRDDLINSVEHPKYKVWQYGLWSFQMGGTKLKRFLAQNQHTQRKV